MRRSVVPLLLVPLLLSACGDEAPRRLAPPDPAPVVVPSSPTAPSPTAEPAGTLTPSAHPSPTSTSLGPRVLRLGDSGSDVLAWQRRLADNGFWLGAADGTFGPLTQQATWALEKTVGLRRDGQVGAVEREALDGARDRLRARTTSGRAIEIDLERQLLLVVESGRVRAVLNTSTGSGATYVDGGRTKRAVTPRGTFTVHRQINGLRRSPLGVLWRPKYFNGGIAVHGAPEIPPWPASHGCVRLSNAAMNWIWSDDLMPLGAVVHVH